MRRATWIGMAGAALALAGCRARLPVDPPSPVPAVLASTPRAAPPAATRWRTGREARPRLDPLVDIDVDPERLRDVVRVDPRRGRVGWLIQLWTSHDRCLPGED